MSWYFFGGFSAYAMVPSGSTVNHSRMLLGPRMVGRALQRQVERHLEPLIARRGDEVVEVVDGAQLGMDGVVAALVAADRPRRADVVRVRR